MLIGGIIGWVIAPPWLLSQGLIAADARRVDILLLIMWPAVGMLVAGGMSALLLQMARPGPDVQGACLVRKRVRRSAASLGLDRKPRREHLSLIAVQAAFFGTPIWHSVARDSALSMPLGLVALRVLGETNWGPISTMANVMQAIVRRDRARRSARQHGLERHHRRRRRRIGRADAGLPGRPDDRLDAEDADLHAAASRCQSGRWRWRSCIRCCAIPMASSASNAQLLQPDVAAMGRLRQARDAGADRAGGREPGGRGTPRVDDDVARRRRPDRGRAHVAGTEGDVAAATSRRRPGWGSRC